MTQEVLPFAIIGGGDLWGFIENGTEEPYIGRYYHPEDEGEYCAENLAGAILRIIIEFAAEPAVWVDENGEVREVDYSEEEMQGRMRAYHEIFDGLLPMEYLEVIRQLSEKRFQKCTYNNHDVSIRPELEAVWGRIGKRAVYIGIGFYMIGDWLVDVNGVLCFQNNIMDSLIAFSQNIYDFLEKDIYRCAALFEES